MDIKTFVAETLIQIVEGVEAAQSNSKSSPINPAYGKLALEPGKEAVIEFDLTVAVEDKKRMKGGANIKIANVAKESARSNAITNRVKFSVPVAFRLSKNWPAKQ